PTGPSSGNKCQPLSPSVRRVQPVSEKSEREQTFVVAGGDRVGCAKAVGALVANAARSPRGAPIVFLVLRLMPRLTAAGREAYRKPCASRSAQARRIRFATGRDSCSTSVL